MSDNHQCSLFRVVLPMKVRRTCFKRLYSIQVFVYSCKHAYDSLGYGVFHRTLQWDSACTVMLRVCDYVCVLLRLLYVFMF